MPYCAQTNLQLLAQLRATGRPGADLQRVRAAYDLASTLVSGVYSPCGKPLLEHLVGTASIAIEIGRPTDVAVAMLLHAVYPSGDFGLRGVRTAFCRAEVRAVAGPDVEAQIWAYQSLQWNWHTRPTLHARLDALVGTTREAVVMRLVNTLELHHDLAALYCENAEAQRQGIERQGGLMVEMATRLDLPILATALHDAFAALEHATVPVELRRRAGSRHRFVRPLSYRRRFPAAVAAGVRRLLRLTARPHA